VAAVALVLSAACDLRGQRADEVPRARPERVAVPEAQPSGSFSVPAAAAAALPAAQAEECQVVDVSPARLTANWPTLLGQRVRFPARVERSLELTRAIIIGEGERFVVFLSPSDAWESTQARVFTVMGSRTVNAGTGAITLPDLILIDEDCGS
jgi:hypothetical protein